jgi:hypothetical protein
MESFRFWQKWIFWASLIIITFGVFLAFLNGTFLFSWMNDGINSPFWPDANLMTPAIRQYQQFSTGLLGSLMASWGLTFLFISHFAFQRKEEWAWNCLAASVGLWFLMDESLSLFYRVYFNALANLGFLALLAIPLLFIRKNFFHTEEKGD